MKIDPKINPVNTIRISGRISTLTFLKGLKKGVEIPATIVSRPNSREAVLEIAGKKIRAEFPGGVPGNNRLNLKLEEQTKDSFLFRLIDTRGRTGFLEKILDHTIFRVDDFTKNDIIDISRFLGKNPQGLFELNKFLLGIHQKNEQKQEKTVYILNRLLRMGLSKESLFDLSFMLSGAKYSSSPLLFLLLLFNPDRKYTEQWLEQGKTGGADIEERLNEIINLVDNVNEEKDKKELIEQLIDLLIGNNEKEKTGIHYGEMAFFDDGEFKPVYCMGNENSWIFSFQLSEIGQIDILANSRREGLFLSIFSPRQDVLDSLEGSADLLYSRLERIGLFQGELSGENRTVYLNFYNRRAALDKLIEINSYYSINSEFDIKA
ncbi:MAG: flagellar hook-length control protein FliK [bacterium]|nr:flagellar hook-length control protein FliK [bacterium]